MAKDATHAVTFDDDMFSAMIDLCSNVRALWDSPTTTYQDRRQILCLLIKHVIHEHRDAECIRLRIVWDDGTPDTAATVNLGGYVNRVMLDMLNGGDDFATIAAKCNQEGIPTGRGREWTAHTSRKPAVQEPKRHTAGECQSNQGPEMTRPVCGYARASRREPTWPGTAELLVKVSVGPFTHATQSRSAGSVTGRSAEWKGCSTRVTRWHPDAWPRG